MDQYIKVQGARQHNLKNVNVDIPKGKLVVFTGLSGSGKSSLAFDTIYAEGQRRYVESLSSYARQFLGIMNKPDVDAIEGLSPAISIEQKTTSHNPRSTVGTVTEIYDYLRLLFARVGHPHCPLCGREISQQSSSQIAKNVLNLIHDLLKEKPVARFLILSPVVRGRKGEFSNLLENLRSKGYTRVRIDGKFFNLDEDLYLLKNNRHNIDVVLDRISFERSQLKEEVAKENLRSRISESVEQGLGLSEGLVIAAQVNDSSFDFPEKPKEVEEHLFSERFACAFDNISFPEIEPRIFSFNSPHGACPTCSGIGALLKINSEKIINPRLSLSEGGILPLSTMFENDTWYSRIVKAVAGEHGFSETIALGNLNEEQIKILFYGTGKKIYKIKGDNRQGRMTQIEESYDGIISEMERRYSQTESDFVRREISKYMEEKTCPDCQGARLREEALSITVNKKSIVDVCRLSINNALEFFTKLSNNDSSLSEREREVAKLILKEIIARLNFLLSVGLEYLTLDRPSGTLSGGEAQRIRLASQIGSGLTGVLYVLDEPTIGLHQRDNKKLIKTLKHLRDLGNSVIVVEHDREMMEEADWILDFGPGAGKHGGVIVFAGTKERMVKDKRSLTGEYLAGKKDLWVNRKKYTVHRTQVEEKWLALKKATKNNLKGIDLKIPLGKLICVTGVSGSGKSSLVVDTLQHAIKQELANWDWREKKVKEEFTYRNGYKEIIGLENISKLSLIDQSPIGRTPRSNPATYTGVFNPIRELYSQSPEARVRGYKPGRFSFNVKGGRCEACEGQGVNKIEMQFLSDVYVTCDICHGTRYNRETLEVEWHGKNIADVLKLTVEEARDFFANIPHIVDKLDTLMAVGLNYMELGQSATTLSGGEAQRIKLSAELGKRPGSSTLYILDEPTTGLHFSDLEKLIRVLHELVGLGNTVMVIEHNLDVIKNSDYIVDLGPEGGDKGGEIVVSGSPLEVSKCKKSYTGQYLAKII